MRLSNPIGLALLGLGVGLPTADATTITELPLLPTPAGYSAAPYVAHINSSGEVVGTIYFTRKPCPRCPTVSIIRSFLVANGIATQVGPDGFVITSSNDAGAIVGNLRNPADALNYPYIVQAGVLTPLSATPGSVLDINSAGQVTYLPALNDHGLFAAMLSDNEHGNHAFKFTGTVPLTDLTCTAPSSDYECMTGYNTGFDFVTDMNNGATIADAMAVGGDRDNPWSSSYGMQHAFVGYQGQTTYLSAGFTAAALSVNDAGVIAGYDDGAAVLWLPAGPGAWSEVTVASLANDPAWVFREARAVNNAGLVAGGGTHNGVAAAFLMEPGVAAAELQPTPAPMARLAAYPNPGRGAFHLQGVLPASAASVAHLTIVDLAGRRVAALDAPVVDGRVTTLWDGRQRNGAPVPAGIYYARLEAGAITSRTKLVVTR